MIDVCSAVDFEMSPINASAPVLKMPIARPDSPSRTAKNHSVFPADSRKQAAANSTRPTTIVRRRPNRSASDPSTRPATAIPVIVAYWNVPAAVSDNRSVRITSGMITPTESVVIANIANIR